MADIYFWYRVDHILANKWRPNTFDEVLGQDTTVQALKNALDRSLLHYCYIFTGIRGVGKTTLARLFAKSLNCEQGLQAHACGQCSSCVGIKEGNDLDCYEIDAASRTKVEETLKILDLATYPPTRSRYKIFLIDEVHMLSNHSFNALLKTLEQPPSHVKFLLATTDISRIPDTVRSRCIEFTLNPGKKDDVQSHIRRVCEAEDYQIDDQALETIVDQANGSVRDAITLLQTLMTASNDRTITNDLVERVMGIVSEHVYEELVKHLESNHREKILSFLEHLSNQQTNYMRLIDQCIVKMSRLAKISQSNGSNFQNWIQIALLTKRDAALYPSMKIAFEMMIMRMLEFVPKINNLNQGPITDQKKNYHKDKSTQSI
ncbi:MAG: DNA polymerase III, subunit gamma and tau [Legionellales bacterium]|nr:DNA polymerase III, subunit gamma and tau [Legionellales bacterium]OUX68277.1 MAG: DNA polymerase III, subunit gamma and tau [bacterium TMED178]